MPATMPAASTPSSPHRPSVPIRCCLTTPPRPNKPFRPKPFFRPKPRAVGRTAPFNVGYARYPLCSTHWCLLAGAPPALPAAVKAARTRAPWWRLPKRIFGYQHFAVAHLLCTLAAAHGAMQAMQPPPPALPAASGATGPLSPFTLLQSLVPFVLVRHAPSTGVWLSPFTAHSAGP